MASGTTTFYQERILAALQYMQHHLDKDLDRDALAKAAGFSHFHFSRIFKAIMGEGAAEHLRRLRLERAAGRLRFSRERILDIALDAGFESHEAFTRAFVAMFGCSPTVFRSLKGGRRLPAPEAIEKLPTQPAPVADARIHLELEPLRHIAFARATGPYMESAGRAWPRILAWAEARNLLGPDTEFLSLSHDDPEVTPIEHLRYDAAITIPAGMTSEGDVGVRTLPAGRYARYRHEGPVQEMGDGWWHLMAWLPASGYRIGECQAFEIYRPHITFPPPERATVDLYLCLEED